MRVRPTSTANRRLPPIACAILVVAATLALGPAPASAQQQWATGPVPGYGLWGMGSIVALLLVFLLLRGRIKIEHGWAGRSITRFGAIERFAHWLLASSFSILALTGLNGVYGHHLVLPMVGADRFSEISLWGRWLHHHVGVAFMAGLALAFLLWLRFNLPHWRDAVWLLKGGGMLVRRSHPPALKFNAGQKLLFWLVMLGGVSLSLSGVALLFPRQSAVISKSFDLLNSLASYAGLAARLPAHLTSAQEMHYAATLHGVAGLALIVVIIAHIYIRTLGVQGAFRAMGSGQVDVNWARQHHSIWAQRELERLEEQMADVETGAARVAPAE